MIRTTQAARIVSRQRVAAVRTSGRRFATGPHSPPPPPAGSPAPNPEAKVPKSAGNGPLITLTAVTAAGVGAWIYFAQDDKAKAKVEHGVHKAEAKVQEGKDVTKEYAKKVEAYGDKKYEELKSHGNETLADARVRAKAEDIHDRDYIAEAERKAQQTYASTKDYAASTADAARARAIEARNTAAAKYGEAKDTAAHTYEETKDTLAQKYAHARAEAERTYDSARGRAAGAYDDAASRASGAYDSAKGTAEHEYGRAKGAAEETKEEAKQGWFSWLGWGKAKKEEAAWQKDELKRDAAGKVAAGAEDVREWADGKKGETRPEKAGAVKRADQYTSTL